MKKIAPSLILISLTLLILELSAQVADNPLRGLYVNGFAAVDSNDKYIPELSILGVDKDLDQTFENEQKLLNYAKQNHFTTLILYNLRTVFNSTATIWNALDNRYESLPEHLCRFMQTARNDYNITRILAAVSGRTEVTSVSNYNDLFSNPTPPIQLTTSQINSAFYTPRLQQLVQQYSQGDSMLVVLC